jgi:hypothetical protein
VRRLSLVMSMEEGMRNSQQSWRTIALACSVAALFAAAWPGANAVAQDDSTVDPAVKARQSSEIRRGDPSRWYRDDPSRQARLRTLQKEIGAAYQEAKNACREGAAAGRGACLKEARATYEQDMKNAPAQLDTAPEGATRQASTQ